MRVVEYEKFGPPDVLKIKERTRPIPKDDEVLIRIYATTVSSGDSRMRAFRVNPLMWLPMHMFLGFFGPRKKVLGYTLAGIVEEVGQNVTSFQKGDKVFGSAGLQGGTHAEYICLPEKANLISIPEGMSYEEATSIPFGGTTALYFLRKGNIQNGNRVLIYGASGALGTAAVQIAKHLGASVTGVCSKANLELVRSLGAGKALDYKEKGVLQHERPFDVIFDTVGKSPFSDCVAALTKEGIYLRAVHMELVPLLRGFWVDLTSKKKVIGGVSTDLKEDLEYLKVLYTEGKFKPVIDKTYPLEQIIEAHSHVDTGHKKGNVVILMTDNEQS